MKRFNPRTREGCDVSRGLSETGHRCFNPRTREGCDLTVGGETARGECVSIHAPVKGATEMQAVPATCQGGFNPRTREGCDLSNALRCLAVKRFNPRTREGCDSQICDD